MTNAYFRGAVGVLLIYDITKRDSFESIPNWINRLKESTNDDPIVMLIGNKINLQD